MEEKIINAINDFLSSVVDFSLPTVLAINKKENTAKVSTPNSFNDEWEIFPIRNFIKINEKGLIEPDTDAIKKFCK